MAKDVLFSKEFVYGVSIGVTVGVCFGWLLRGRRLKPMILFRDMPTAEECYSDLSTGEYKLVLVVRNDLKMGKGKAAAQCSHASVLASLQAFKTPEVGRLWSLSGQRKVVVRVEDEESLLDLAREARQLGLLTSLVRDAGRTQVEAGTRTVLGVGPGPEDLVDRVTGHLKLY